MSRAAIYEVFVQDFSPEGNLDGVTAGLDRIQSAGADVIWLMPIHPLGVLNRKDPLGSPYSVRDFRAINPAYGNANDLRELVRAAHARNMKVIIDWVPDHTSWDHVWVQEHPDWYFRDANGRPMVPRDANGRLTDWTDVIQLDYGNPALRREMIAIMQWWIREFDLDGYRVDVAGFVPTAYWREAVPAVRAAVPKRLLMLAEWGDIELNRIGYDLTYGWDGYNRIKEVWTGRPANEFVQAEVRDLQAGGWRLRFSTNHDETAWDNPPVVRFGGSAGARAAFTAMALLPGRPMIYNGQEVESPQKLPLFDRQLIQWNQPNADQARAYYRKVLELARTHPAFTGRDLAAVTTSAPEDIIAYSRGDAVVLVNARNREVRFTVTSMDLTGARDLTGANRGAFGGGALTLPAYGTLIMSRTQPVRTGVTSPDGRTRVTVGIEDGRLFYSVSRDGRELFAPSGLGFEFKGAPPLRDSLRITDTTRATHDEVWTQPWGEVARVRDHHNELAVGVAETGGRGRRFTLRVRVFDDGLGFRYEFPDQPALANYEISDELTEFTLAEDARSWWIPSNRGRMDRSEMLYSSSPVSLLDSVQTPLTMSSQDGRTWMVIHEANLVDYARLNLAGRRMESRTLRAALAPWADGVKVRGRGAFNTPWRTIQLADRLTQLSPSVLGLNLNPPSVITTTDWIRPMKYVGIWWGMHINTMTWGSGPIHGATTANTKRYIDFAAANNIGGVLVEGWNTGWDGDWIANRNAFSFTQAYPDYDLAEVARYARSKGVSLIVHNETSGGIQNYERQMDSAFALYRSLGLTAIKSGYVTDTTAEGHSHWSQFMVRHYRRVIEEAARNGIMLDVHEPIHDTGERRTYPNMMSREGARGQEYNAWGGEGGNPPEHEVNLFFTRLLAGPMDYTPGIFDILIERGTGRPRTPGEARVRTTLAKQLALYVVLYSPMQMAADLPENYENQPAFQFIRDVAVDWDTTRVLEARMGDYVAVARRERGSQTWYLGAITDEEARTLTIPLTFLRPGRSYVAEVYADGPNAHWRENPLPVSITRRTVTSATRLTVRLAPGGGQAIRIRPAG